MVLEVRAVASVLGVRRGSFADQRAKCGVQGVKKKARREPTMSNRKEKLPPIVAAHTAAGE